MKKRVLSIVLAVVMCLGLLPGLPLKTEAAQGGATGEVFWEYEDGVLTISGKGWMPDYEPWSDDTSVQRPWGRYSNSIHTVIVKEGVETIGTRAFCEFPSLTTVSLPEGLKFVGNYAFENDAALHEITLPSSLESVEYGSFKGSGLTAIVIPAGTDIWDEGFADCSSLESVTFSVSESRLYQRIGTQAFVNCTSLKSVTVPKTISEIGEYAFGFDHANSKINFGSSSNPKYFCISGYRFSTAYWYTRDFTGIEFDSLGSGYTHSYSYDTQTLTIFPEATGEIYSAVQKYTLEELKPYLPWGENAEDIREIVVKEGITSIGARIFAYLPALEKVTIPSTVKIIDADAFAKCPNLKNVILSDGLETIGAGAFSECPLLEEIYIPDTVTLIGWQAFYEDTSLRKIHIPANLKVLEWEVFYHCEALKEIDLPASLESAEMAFYESSIEKVNLEDGMKTISYAMFYGLDKVTELELPDSVVKIDKYAFYECKNLRSVNIPEKVTEIGYQAFTYCNALTELTIPTGCQTFGEFAFAGMESLKSIKIPEGVETLPRGILTDCRALEEVVLPNSLKKIEEQAFASNDNLKSLRIPESVTSIAEHGVGYKRHWDAENQVTIWDGVQEDFTILGVENSEAQRYADSNGIPFKVLYNLNSETCTVDPVASVIFTGQPIEPKPEVRFDRGEGMYFIPKEGTGITYSYSDNLNAGTATITIQGIGELCGTRQVTFTINKAANSITAKAKNVTVKYSKVKKKNQTVTAKNAYTIKNKQGKVTYKLTGVTKSKFKKYFSVNKTSGKITVKKGLKKGTYKLKISVTAAGNGNYNKATKKITVKVVVK